MPCYNVCDMCTEVKPLCMKMIICLISICQLYLLVDIHNNNDIHCPTFSSKSEDGTRS